MRGSFSGTVLMCSPAIDKGGKPKGTFKTFIVQEGVSDPQKIITFSSYKGGDKLSVIADVGSFNGFLFIKEVKPNGSKG